MHIFTNAIKRLILPGLVIGITSIAVHAQQNTRTSQSDSTRQANDTQKVSGTIKDAATGKPLDGIGISVPGYSASITDKNGFFKISVPDFKSAVIVVSGEGFQSTEIALKGRKEVEAVLYEDSYSSQLDEVNLPYSQVLGNKTIGAVKSLNISDNWQRISEGPDTYLQGRAAGLNVIRRSGTQGIGASLFLRGYNSIYTSNQPLYIIDGIYYDNNDYGSSLIAGHVENPLANIDLKDLDNITLIKDATASSYGTKAANGVILITTARAKEQATKIDFAAYSAYNMRPKSIPVLNNKDFRTYLSDVLITDPRYAALSPSQAQAKIQSDNPYLNDDPTAANYYSYHQNTDWQTKTLNSSYDQNYYLKVTGGDNIATYGLAVGYLNNQGIIKNTDLTRYQTRFNADLNLSNKVTGNANLSFVSNEQDIRDEGVAPATSPIYLGLTKAPFLSPNEVSETGALSPNLAGVDVLGFSNPRVITDKVKGSNKNYRLLASVGFKYQFTKSLNLNVLGGITFSKVRENIFLPEKGVLTDTLTRAIARNRSGTNVERLYAIFNDTRLSYTKTFNNIHELSTNLGFRFNNSKSESDFGLGYNSATDDYTSVVNGQASLRTISGQNGSWRSLNTYFNTDYALKHRYFLSFNLGVDASSRFGKTIADALTINGNNYAVMPSGAAGWLISSEPFMANSKTLDLLKIRASYGQVGNDDIGNFTAKQYYISQNFLGSQGLVRGNIPNTSLKWETVKKADLGIDAGLFNDRLSITLDAFRNVTSDMLVQQPVNTITGFDYAYSNEGGMKTNGFEVGVSGRILSKSVKWDMGINFSTYRNELTKIPGGSVTNTYAGATVLSQVGLPVNMFYGYKTHGVYTSDAEATGSKLAIRNPDGTIIALKGGDVRFTDSNGDGFIDANDRQVIGNPNPDFTGMFSNAVSWNRFSMDALVTFSKGNDVYNFLRRNLESMNGLQNQSPIVENRWKAAGQVTDIPRASIGDPTGNSRFSDRWIEDGSYIRLRTVSVTYSLPLKTKALKYAKVYLSGNNLVTLTKYLGYDPEFSGTGSPVNQGIDAGLEPQFKTVQLGVRIGL